MKLKNKLLLATIVSLGVYIFLVYIAIKIFLYPELLKSELNNIYEKEQKSEVLIKQELQNLKDLTNIIAANMSSYNDSINFSTIADFIYIVDGNKGDGNFFISQKFKSNKKLDQNEIKKLLKNDLSANMVQFTDIVNTQLGVLFLAFKKLESTDNSEGKIIIAGQFLQDSVIRRVNFGTGWNIKILFDKKLINNLLVYKENSKSRIGQNKKSKNSNGVIEVSEQRELLVDKSQLKSYYLLKVGSFKKDLVLEISIKEGLIYHSNNILIFTFLATLLSGPLALLFLILIVRIIQAHGF